jgi:hypothetical protein
MERRRSRAAPRCRASASGCSTSVSPRARQNTREALELDDSIALLEAPTICAGYGTSAATSIAAAALDAARDRGARASRAAVCDAGRPRGLLLERPGDARAEDELTRSDVVTDVAPAVERRSCARERSSLFRTPASRLCARSARASRLGGRRRLARPVVITSARFRVVRLTCPPAVAAHPEWTSP